MKTLLLLIYLLAYINCDIPVDCKKHQIQGEWVFRISNDVFQPSLNNDKTSCSHGFPDKIDETLGDKDYSFPDYKDMVVTLNGDYKVYEEGMEIGTWTPVYNEGFIANFKGSQFTAFMKYFKGSNGSGFQSNCDKTMIGWYVPDTSKKQSNWSCFFGFKSKIKRSFTSALIQVKNFLKSRSNLGEAENDKIEMFYKNDPIFLETKSESKVKLLKYDEQLDLVDEINSNNLSWKAGFNDNFKGMTFAEVNEKIGSKNKFTKKNRSYSKEMLQTHKKSSKTHKSNTSKKINSSTKFDNNREIDSQFVKDQNIINKYQDTPLESIDSSTLPLNWDWRNVGGVSYIPPVRIQADCGSCYIFSSVSGLEARLRIKTLNQDKTLFSKQFVVSCNPYTEGCHGGYPVLVGKFLSEFEMIPETCFPYQGRDVQCSKRCNNLTSSRRYFVSEYGYLGGYYGATNEELMMKEIRAHGPMPGNMIVPWNFSYYRSGVYMFNKPVKNNNNKISRTTLFDRELDWQKVDHSILLVGWGEENGIKYWIGMNTWGTSFGENGFFKILRGENECNIESMGDFLRIRFEDR